jgi:hypothetical protein
LNLLICENVPSLDPEGDLGQMANVEQGEYTTPLFADPGSSAHAGGGPHRRVLLLRLVHVNVTVPLGVMQHPSAAYDFLTGT